jgi:large subunit ribosomal protein L25
MTKIIPLRGEERAATGRGNARSLRRKGHVPAIIYGGGREEICLSVTEKDVTAEYHKGGFMSHLFDLDIGGKKFRAIPKAVQLHPVTDRIIHVDFMHVDVNSTVKVMVTVEFTNKEKSIGIKLGGILNIPKHQIELECPVEHIPEKIEYDIENLAIGASVHINDLALPKNVKATEDGSLTIATIVGRAKETTEETAGGASSEESK